MTLNFLFYVFFVLFMVFDFCFTIFHLCSDLGHCHFAHIAETINLFLCTIIVGVGNIEEIRGPEGKKAYSKGGIPS